jgi:tetratricopeptide (TPR) repeat protein
VVILQVVILDRTGTTGQTLGRISSLAIVLLCLLHLQVEVCAASKTADRTADRTEALKTASRSEQLGDAALSQGHYGIARRLYANCLVEDPNNVQVLIKLAHAEEQIGDLDQAIARGRLACQLAPKRVDAHMALASFLEANRDDKAAELQYERALELRPQAETACLAQGRIVALLIKLDSVDQADRLSKDWLHKDNKSPDCHFNRGLVLSQSAKPENWQEAASEFKKTLLLSPDLNRAHYQLALLDLKRGDKRSAKEELETFIKSDPKGNELVKAKELLTGL